MHKRTVLAVAIVALLWSATARAQTNAELTSQVRAAETAFAKSMADRNAAAFASLLADDTVFFGGQGVMRGKSAVAAGWKRFFDGPSAPFSWQPAEVEVIA